jgi:hypothetical protein
MRIRHLYEDNPQQRRRNLLLWNSTGFLTGKVNHPVLLLENGSSLLQENNGLVLLEPSNIGDPGMIGSTFVIGTSALA